MSFAVYWIREQSHTDLMTQGYIGVSGDVEKRFASHKGMWSGTNNYLRNAIKKHGWDNLAKSVLLISTKEYCLDIERKLRPADKIGWNLTIGGGYPPVIRGERPELKGRVSWNKGRVGLCSAETLERMRQKRLGVSPANKGVPLSDEHRQKVSKALKGRVSPRKGAKLSAELVERISAKNRGRVQSAEERAMRSAVLKGIKKSAPMSDEHRAKLGLIAKGKRWYNNGQNVVFCLEGLQPDGYTLGRKSIKLCKEK
jgi:predicted GIY-YIG superfamily endonuclease